MLEINFAKKAAGKSLEIKYFSGAPLIFTCSDQTEKVVENAAKIKIDEALEEECGEIREEQVGDPETIARQWSPWWFEEASPLPADSWRAETESREDHLSLKQYVEQGKAALEGHDCADFMDAAGLRGQGYNQEPEFMKAVAACMIDLNLFDAAHLQLKKMEALGVDPGWVAFMMGRCLAGQGQHKKALEWYDQANRRKFQNLTLLSHYAAISAEKAQMAGVRQRWLEASALNENDFEKIPSRWSDAITFRNNRKNIASIDSDFYMDGQALPVNSKKASIMPGGAQTSRSTVVDVKGQWFASRKIGRDAALTGKGIHTLKRPYLSSLSVGQVSTHEGTVGVIAEMSSGFVSDWAMGATLGTGISGNERQRDLFAWYLEAASRSRFEYGLRFDNKKYLDPKPGGSDVIDIDMSRYTGEADHSHLDYGLTFFANSPGLERSWKIELSYTIVDYRVVDMLEYDHTRIEITGDLIRQTSPNSEIIFHPFLINKNFKSAGSAESNSGLDIVWKVHTEPLWIGKLLAGMQTRAVSGDDVSTYSRHYYGVGLSRDF
jgi:tetratricopeptide (TPR) repeat protein